MADGPPVASMPQKLMKSVSKLAKATQFKLQYKTNEDFGAMDPDLKRLMVVGCTGAGKSTLLNRVAGSHCTLKESDDGKDVKMEWDSEPLFHAGADTQGVTTHTTFANLNFMGKDDRPFVCIDTPGHDDPGGIGVGSDTAEGRGARDKLSQQAGDMYQKLMKMGFVNTILVLHNDPSGNRLNPATYEVLEKLDQMFEEADGNVWNHVVVGYSKCDPDAKGWKADMETKMKKMRQALKDKFAKCKDIDVPILSLSSLEFDDEKVKVANEATLKNFEQLWDFNKSKPNLSTEKLRKFKGMSDKIEEILHDRDLYQRLSEARQFFAEVAMKILGFTLVFFIIVRPWINMSGVMDEIAIFGFFFYCLGLWKVYDFFRIFWDEYVLYMLEMKKIITKEQVSKMKLLEDASKEAKKKKDD